MPHQLNVKTGVRRSAENTSAALFERRAESKITESACEKSLNFEESLERV